MKVLIIDTDDDILLTASVSLRHFGFEPYTVKELNDCVSPIRNIKPDVIFIDVPVNSDTTRSICRQIKDEQGISDIPVILFSTSPGDIRKVEEYGAVDFLEKPYEVTQLANLVRKYSGPGASN
jgi:DNA-binding response OmpR family regulator